MPPKKREESSEASEASSEEDVPGWGAYIIGNTRIHAHQRKVNRDEVLSFPVNMESFHRLMIRPVFAASGAKHTVILGADKKLYGWGCNIYGQLGIDNRKFPFLYKWTLLKSAGSKGIIKVACGNHHTLFLSEHGTVFGCGLNDKLQLGSSKTKEMRWELQPVKLTGVTSIAAGGATSFASNQDGDVYVWGDAGAGHSGLGPAGDDGDAVIVDRPTKITTFEDNGDFIEQVVASPRHMLALSGSEVYSCGKGDYGVLGHDTPQDEGFPRKIAFSVEEKETNPAISLSYDASYLTTELKGKDHIHPQVRVWGRVGEAGCESRLKPNLLEACPREAVKKIEGGRGWHMLSTETGDVYTWGNNTACANMGLLATEYKNKRVEPNRISLLESKHVIDFTCSDEYAIIFVDFEKSEDPEHFLTVPVFGRYDQKGGLNSTPSSPFEMCRKAFLACCEEGQYVEMDEISECSLDGIDRETRGSSGLRVGDEVSIWMTDVWAWAIIKEVKGDGAFKVKWEREDWKDMGDVDLLSEDEKPEGESDDRWTFGFYEFWNDEEESEEESESEESDDEKEEPPKKKGRKN